MKLPQYNGKDNMVMLIIVPTGAMVLNIIIFGWQYISHWAFFGAATVLAVIALAAFFILCGFIAIRVKKRFPGLENMRRRIGILCAIFLMLGGVMMYGLLQAYAAVSFFQYQFNDRDFAWIYYSASIFNVFTVLLMEGIDQFQEWQDSQKATENLQQALKKSQLDGLKSQVNPHFLFNSLNSLSSLIEENEQKAEQFLNELSKVYRYMLKEGEQRVPLRSELVFLESYQHILAVRFGEGLQITQHIDPNYLNHGIAPLTLQAVIENAFTYNIVQKSQPLRIEIATAKQGLNIKHNLQYKNSTTDWQEADTGLDHLVATYKLLQQPIQITDDAAMRTIHFPLV
ncbi:MAG TPA: histidine kinase [Saprospiraceae bacterium]|nr:histidine kinase [Saprospiraceae bacterium]